MSQDLTVDGCESVGKIWVPVAGGGSASGHRYRDALRTLDVPEVSEAYGLALGAVEKLADSSGSDLGEWAGHGPALSVYAMWAVYALEAHRVISVEEAKDRLKHLAKLQQRNGLYPGYPGIHYGRSSGWLAPAWWGSGIHLEHQQALIAKDATRYSVDVFARGSFLEDVPANSPPFNAL